MEIIKTHNISDTLKFSVENGYYGPFIRLSRGERWIRFSSALWKLILKNIHLLESDNFNLSLTKEKEINVILLNNKRYVSFHHIYKKDDKVKDIYINLNEEEWSNFKNMLPLCHDVQKVQLFDNCMEPTRLTPKQLRDVKENNETAYNQLAYQCEYCGNSYDYGICHCHRYNCQECEPLNFCRYCDSLVVEEKDK